MCAGRGQRDDDDSKGTEEPDNRQHGILGRNIITQISVALRNSNHRIFSKNNLGVGIALNDSTLLHG